MRILLTGINGQVGWELQRTLAGLGQVAGLGSADMNLSDPDAIRARIRDIRPDVIVNPAAYTAVDRAESEASLAQAINGLAPGIIAEEAKRLGARLIHYSTDYVFDGSKDGPYVETDATGPLNVYGASKLAGEQAIQAVGGSFFILRTSWVYGLRGKNFLLTMARLLREKSELRVVNDQWGAPTWSRMIAETTAHLLARHDSNSPERGIFHFSAGGRTSWHGFAEAIAAGLAARGATVAQVLPIPASDYPTPARRPANSVMSNARLHEAFGLALPDWQDSLALALADGVAP